MIDLFVDIQHSPEAVLISPRVVSAQPLHYRLSVTRGGVSGVATLEQQGEIASGIAPSSVRLSLNEGDSCQVLFEVLRDGVVLQFLEQPCQP